MTVKDDLACLCWTDIKRFENVRATLDKEEVPTVALLRLSRVYRRSGGAWEKMSTLVWLKILMRRERMERWLTARGRRLEATPMNSLVVYHTRDTRELASSYVTQEEDDDYRIEYEKIMRPLFCCLPTRDILRSRIEASSAYFQRQSAEIQEYLRLQQQQYDLFDKLRRRPYLI